MFEPRIITTRSGQTIDAAKIGASSDIAAIVGCSPWSTAWDVWRRLVFDVDTISETERMRWGSRLEPVIFAGWVEDFDRSGREWVRGGSRAFDQWPWLRVSTDYECAETREIVEVKNADGRNIRAWDVLGGMRVPEHYEIQVQTQLHALDFNVAYFAVLFGGNDLRSIRVRRNQTLAEIVIDAAAEFVRDYVLTKTPPPPDGSTACRDYLSRIGSDKKEARAADAFESAIVLQYKKTAGLIKKLGAKKDELANRILAAIGPDEYGLAGDFGRIIAPFTEGRQTTKWRAVVDQLREHTDEKTVAECIDTHTQLSAARRSLKGVWTS